MAGEKNFFNGTKSHDSFQKFRLLRYNFTVRFHSEMCRSQLEISNMSFLCVYLIYPFQKSICDQVSSNFRNVVSLV